MGSPFRLPVTAIPTPPLNDGSQPAVAMDSHSFTGQPQSLQNQKQFEPYVSDPQLGFGSATRTTVVTTTTTTTTSYPQMIFRAPRNLLERDPKQYPLAAKPTPLSLRRFNFEVQGQMASFEEQQHEAGKSTLDFDLDAPPASAEKHAALLNYDLGYATPVRGSGSENARPRLRPSLQQRSVHMGSPISISEAAELASLQRRNRLLQPAATLRSLSHTATSNQDAVKSAGASAADMEHQRSSGSRRSLRLRRGLSGEGIPKSPRPRRVGREHAEEQDSDVRGPFAPGVSVTPPMAENDMDLIEATTAAREQFRMPRPAPLDTLAAQDAVLPSPSLSPITAAANLSQGVPIPSFSREPTEKEDEIPSFRLSEQSTSQERDSDLQLLSPDSAIASDDLSSQSLSNPSALKIRSIIDSFDALPTELQTYVMYQMLRRSAKPTLHFVADVVNPALKIDFLKHLPSELSMNIVRYLDVKSMCRAAQVCRKWRSLIDSDEKAWKDLLESDGFELPRGEVERAVKEGWGWQYPNGSVSCERDLSRSSSSGSETTSPSASSAAEDVNAQDVNVSSNPRKRRIHSRHHINKKRKIRTPDHQARSPIWSQSLDDAHGPIALADAAMSAIPNPGLGLSSLSNMHLYKSLYHRNYSIRKSWMEENSQPRHFAFQAHGTHVVTCLQFDADKILTGSDDTKINVFDTETGALRRTLDGHEGGVWALQYDGNMLVSGSTDRSVRVWDIETGDCLQIFQGHTSTVRCLVILRPTKIGERDDGSPIMMPEQPLIITGSRDSSLRVWKLPKRNESRIYQTVAGDDDNPYFVRVMTGHHHSVRAIAAHGDTLVSGSYDHTVRVWRISDGTTVQRLVGHAQKVYSVVLDHERNRCISGSMDNMVKVWSLETGQCLFNLEGHTSLVGLLDLNHERLVSAAADSTLRIWDPETGQCKSTLSAHTGAITCFQHDSQKVISGSDRTLKMWNIRTGECVRDLLTGLSGVWQVKFDERRCVAAVQRDNWTYIEVLDFGAARDPAYRNKRGVRTFVDRDGFESEDLALAGNNAAPAA